MDFMERTGDIGGRGVVTSGKNSVLKIKQKVNEFIRKGD